jgi:MFS family permease
VSSSLFLGVVVGSFFCPKIIVALKHVRAYAVFAAMCIAANLLQGLWYELYLWIFLRFVIGFALAGLYIIIESWLLALSNTHNRGQVLGVYMLAFYAGQASSQWLLGIPGASATFLFSIMAGCTAVSVFPLMLTKFKPPHAEKTETASLTFVTRRAPLGVIGCIGSGMVLSVIYAFIPKFLIYAGHENAVADAMFAVILGGTIMQYPIGKLSDRFDRRFVLAGCALMCALVGAFMIIFYDNINALRVLCFLLGGSSFLIYPISIAYTIDRIDPQHVLSAVAVLYIAYAVGSVAGPLVMVPFLQISDLTGYFIYIGIASLALASACVIERLHSPKQPEQEMPFVSVPQSSIEVTQLDPRSDEK